MMIVIGLLIGCWQWQVNNINNEHAMEEARENAVMRGATSFSWSANSAPVEDRALGMAFAFLLCGVGCFGYAQSSNTLRSAPSP
jgi:hypothetical protein